MIVFAVLAAIASTQPSVEPSQPVVAAVRQAQATVTIVRAETVRFTEIEKSRPWLLRATVIRSRDGSTEPAKLVEFE